MALSVHFSWILENLAGGSKATLLAIVVGVVVYALVLLAVGALSRQDFEMLPGGETGKSVIQAEAYTRLGRSK